LGSEHKYSKEVSNAERYEKNNRIFGGRNCFGGNFFFVLLSDRADKLDIGIHIMCDRFFLSIPECLYILGIQ
jgi:hypothetical protein